MAKHKRSEKRGRKKLLIPGVLALTLIVGVATWFFFQKPASVSLAAQYKGGPRLAVDKELIDFGLVQFEQMVEARFRLRNVGDQPLRLVVNPQVEAIEGC